MASLKRIPLHPFLLAIYPVLALLAVNLREVEFWVVWRPLVITFVCSILVFLFLKTLLKDSQKAALVATLLLILFFSYGHLYDLLRQVLAGVARHRYMIPFYGVLLAGGVWVIMKRIKEVQKATETLNLIALGLVVFAALQIGYYAVRISLASNKLENSTWSEPVEMHTPENLPDVYYIILDSYTRSDVLLDDYDLDNSTFLEELRSMGFYVADCARSNYAYTLGSITSALNMDYLGALVAETGINEDDLWVLLKQSRVRQQLEVMGYKTVAFETGFEWGQIRDADVYLTRGHFGLQLSPFEAMLVDSTAIRVISDTNHRFAEAQTSGPNSAYISRQLYILDELPSIPKIPGAKFVFVHIMVPHIPYVFEADGTIRSDPAFFSGEGYRPINRKYLYEGYRGQVQFISSRIPAILKALIENSATPPIIIIQGDHGPEKVNKTLILNAYYLPNGEEVVLYSSITPVNSFRVVFNTYFGTDFPLLPDTSYYGQRVVKEEATQCIK